MAGFDCDFVSPPPHCIQTHCPVCLYILKEPHQATCCGKSFCKICIQKVKSSGRRCCPTCSTRGRAFCIYSNLGLQQSLYDFRVYCTHKSKGCEWTGELRELDNHLNSDPPADKSLEGCPYTLIRCPLGCATCEDGRYRKDIESHVKDAQLRLFFEEKFQTTIEQLKTQFEEFKRDLAQRTTMLEATVVELSIKNGELESEIKLLKQSHSSQQLQLQEHQHQPTEYITGTYKPDGAEFIMFNFEEFRKENDTWYSPHFYTHPRGYKMCLSVDANGIGSGEGTYLAVFVYVMRGEFDDQLKWPFRGGITIKLVNQEEKEGDHVVETISFTRSTPDKHCERVTAGGRSRNGWGRHRFLLLSKLQPKYLKNDCIRLCIKKVELY
jgi:hypothetical protein